MKHWTHIQLALEDAFNFTVNIVVQYLNPVYTRKTPHILTLSLPTQKRYFVICNLSVDIHTIPHSFISLKDINECDL